MFEFQKTSIEGVYVITPKVYGDKRGYFFESYNKKDFLNAGINIDFVQDNESKSHRSVLRGLHFQKKYPQSKLVRVVKGVVFDVAVDLRKDSKTFGKYESVILSEENQKQFLIPKGFAHGFLVLSDEAKFVYKCDDFYHPEDEGGIIYNDPDININWPFLDNIELSEKDKKHPSFKEIYDYE
ncbi:MAG: dTDP-4-dehydrorhamnose 3,5-epimerase [Candidatus Enterosoma sp.]|nr:dTDP-4-dehydrorhamnose 3,5-epimerase [Bacilli bacterium]MDY5650212.1 dTDP-4-dehydrorhamnose 3,5-epimerase [Candidatus Enterosoma sp.]